MSRLHVSAAVTAEPVFIVSLVLYLTNKAGLLPFGISASDWARSYMSDLLLVPVALPAILLVARATGLRPLRSPPTPQEAILVDELLSLEISSACCPVRAV
jgi:hypothetical protein